MNLTNYTINIEANTININDKIKTKFIHKKKKRKEQYISQKASYLLIYYFINEFKGVHEHYLNGLPQSDTWSCTSLKII